MKSFKLICYLALLTIGVGGQVAVAEHDALVVIVSTSAGPIEMGHSELVHLYMGRLNRLPSGLSALPLDLEEARETFYAGLVNKRLPEINAYWARLVFSGRASPPRTVATAAEMLNIVSNNPGAIGYVRRADLNDRVQVVMEIGLPATEP